MNEPAAQPASPDEAESSADAPELDRITDAFFALDADGRFTYLNPAMERTLGRQRAEVLGQEIASCWPEAAARPCRRR